MQLVCWHTHVHFCLCEFVGVWVSVCECSFHLYIMCVFINRWRVSLHICLLSYMCFLSVLCSIWFVPMNVLLSVRSRPPLIFISENRIVIVARLHWVWFRRRQRKSVIIRPCFPAHCSSLSVSPIADVIQLTIIIPGSLRSEASSYTALSPIKPPAQNFFLGAPPSLPGHSLAFSHMGGTLMGSLLKNADIFSPD